MVVHEDWDHGNKQKVSEEEELSIGAEDVEFSEVLEGTNGAMPVDNNPQKHENLETDRSAVVVADAPLQWEMVAANGTDQPQVTTTTASHLVSYRSIYLTTLLFTESADAGQTPDDS
jgi:hypothetical protein